MKCKYKNCKNELVNKRKDAVYCCRSCKSIARKLKKRRILLLEKYKQQEMIKVNAYLTLRKIIENK